jgi:hypothetical protein
MNESILFWMGQLNERAQDLDRLIDEMPPGETPSEGTLFEVHVAMKWTSQNIAYLNELIEEESNKKPKRFWQR